MNKLKGIGAYVILFIVVGILGYLATTGFRYLDEHNSMQKEAQIALEDYIGGDKDLPVGEYVSLEARWVIGPFATETSTRTTNGIEATSGEAEYYYLVLEDATVMALKTSNAQEKTTLTRMSDWLMSVDGYPWDGETLKVQGKLRRMTDKQLTELYNKYLQNTFGLSSSDSSVRFLVLDTTAGRSGLYLILGGAAVVIILIAVVAAKKKKKKAQPPEAPANEEMFDQRFTT